MCEHADTFPADLITDTETDIQHSCHRDWVAQQLVECMVPGSKFQITVKISLDAGIVSVVMKEIL